MNLEIQCGPLHMNLHLTLTLSPPIRWERRGNSRRTRTVLWKPASIRQVQGFNAGIFRGILTPSLSPEGARVPCPFFPLWSVECGIRSPRSKVIIRLNPTKKTWIALSREDREATRQDTNDTY
jgi:hypothetical protein